MDVIPDVENQGLPHHVEDARPVRVAVVGARSLFRAVVWPDRADATWNLDHGEVRASLRRDQ